MEISTSYKTKQFLWGVVKLFIVIACGYFIVTKFTQNNTLHFSDFLSKMAKNDLFSLKNVSFFVFLSILNWFFEILKWQKLATIVKKISFKTACIQSLASLTTSLITPNRIGEYGAKALYFKKENRLRIVGLNFIGNFHQMVITLLLGSMGFLYFKHHHASSLNSETPLKTIGITLLLIGMLIWISLSIDVIKKQIQKIKNGLNKIPKSTHFKVVFYAGMRYLIFSHQYYFLLLIFDIQIPYLDAISAISVMYLVSSLIPMFSLFDVVLKGSVAVWVFSYFNADISSILAITSFMWGLNFAIPATLGSYFVLSFKTSFAK